MNDAGRVDQMRGAVGDIAASDGQRERPAAFGSARLQLRDRGRGGKRAVRAKDQQ